MSGIVFACIAPHPPIIVHEVGRGREEETRRTIDALEQVAGEIASLRPETVLIFSPHGPLNPKAFGILTAPRATADMARWGALDLEFAFENDLDAVALIREEAQRAGLPLDALSHWDDGVAPGLDWGCTVPLYYLQSGIGAARLVPIAPSFLSPEQHYAFGQALGGALDRLGKRSAIICSADLSHCLMPGAPGGYNPAGKEFDDKYRQVIEDWDVNWVLETTVDFRRRAAEDAVPQTAMLMGALDNVRVRPRVLSYEGPFGVGYLVAAVDVLSPREQHPVGSGVSARPARPEEETGQPEPETSGPATSESPVDAMHPFVRLAREAVEHYVRFGELLKPGDPAPEMTERAACFVSIKKLGELRGCIGTIEPTQSDVCREIVQNAVSACSRDPRFWPVIEDELCDLTYSVDLLTPPEPVDDVGCLDCRCYGVIVQSGGRRGLLLPDLEGVDTVEQQVMIAKLKAGIPEDEPCDLYRFQVRRFT